MKPIVGALLFFVIGPSSSTVAAQDHPDTPAEEYAALLSEYRPASGGTRNSKTDIERKTAVELMGSFAPRFIALADKHREDAVALQALRQAVQVIGSTDSGAQIAWETNRSDFPAGSSNEAAGQVVALLLRDHLLSDQLGPVCDRMRYGYRIEFVKFLDTVLEQNPQREVKALACLSLAQFLNDRSRMVRLVEDRPELTECYRLVFGDDYLAELRRLERDGLAERIVKLFERAEQYGDVRIQVGGTVADRAKSELYDIRHLGIGKVAPDIAGKDQDGVAFKLSDYRGKVVLLSFWSEY